MENTPKNPEVVIVGGGLVGLLNARYLATEPVTVKIYEKYDDPRTLRPGSARSINLTLSHRGKLALEDVKLLDNVLRDSVAAYGRKVWSGDGEVLGETYYGEKGESIDSLNRRELNIKLLNALEEFENVEIFFNHDLSLCDFDAGKVTFMHTENGEKKEETVSADLFIGADGAHSAMRAEMQKEKKLDYVEFRYHHHWYAELLVPTKNGERQLKKNGLHVWSKDSFALVCLPNADDTFTGILVMPKDMFDQMLESQETLVAFFRREFRKVLNMVGEENLIDQFKPGTAARRNPSRLASLKCEPYHVSSPSGGMFVLHGDAAHAMVPFYGQGMNAGFEDVQIFHSILKRQGYTKDGIRSTLEEFSANRCKDGQAMTDFSHAHYQALSSNVKTWNYAIRRHIDSALHRMFPDSWVPEYTQVVFSTTPFSECRENIEHQNKIISNIEFYGLLLLGGIVMLALFWLWRWL